MIEENNQELNLSIQNYDGPLDLLLELVREKKMDIFAIDLAELASAYLKLINKLKDSDLDLASEYLVMAATLIQLKARMMLENPEDKVEVEQEKAVILKQLIEYQQFKNIAQKLRTQEKERKSIFIKNAEDQLLYAAPPDPSRLDGHADAIKLIIALRKMFERNYARKLRETTLETFQLTPAERRLEIIALLKKYPQPTFEMVFTVPSMEHFVLTILTLLDMARKQEVILKQDKQYDNIIITKGEINV